MQTSTIFKGIFWAVCLVLLAYWVLRIESDRASPARQQPAATMALPSSLPGALLPLAAPAAPEPKQFKPRIRVTGANGAPAN